MTEGSEWVGWVALARKGDVEAIDQLEQYFAPFAHAVLLSRVAHHVAGGLVKPVLVQALLRLGGLSKDEGFGSWVLMAAREKAAEAAKVAGATTERNNADPLLNEGRQVLTKIRLLSEAARERLLMRLLEGIAGFEIAEVVGTNEADLRAELERAAATLVQQLTAQSVSFAGDSYLWSLVGTPHPAVIPLENQLTALRHDPLSPTFDPEVTPMASAPAQDRPRPEGRRATSEVPALSKKTIESTEPSGSGLHGVDEDTAASPVPARTTKAAPVPPAVREPVHNPFGTVVKTIPVSDLPAAADFADLKPLAGPTTAAAVAEDDERESATLANPAPSLVSQVRKAKLEAPEGPTKVRPSGPKKASTSIADDDPDSTSVRPVHPSGLDEPTRPLSSPRSGAWKSSGVVGSPPARAPLGVPTAVVAGGSVTRSWRPFGVAGVFALIAIGVALLLFDGTNRRVRSGWALVPVVVAATDIAEGAVVSIEMVSQRAVPAAFITSSVVKPDSTQYVLNQKILVPVQAGDPLLWTQFEVARTNERLSKKVPRRARAFDLLTNRAIAVGGWVQPNDRIDIIASLKSNEGGKVAITLLQDVTVLSTGKITTSTPNSVAKGDRDYIDVSLLLLPEEAQIIALATEIGELQFTLRTDDDNEILTDHRGSNSKTLLQGERVRLLHIKRFNTIQQIRGTRVVPNP